MKEKILLISFLLIPMLLVSDYVLSEEFSPRIKELQSALNELGYDSGKEDGILGESTIESIKEFQKDHDMVVDGKYSGILLFKVQNVLNSEKRKKTPSGKEREQERQRLLSLSDEQIIKELKQSSKEDAEEVLNLLGERARELPAKTITEILGIENEKTIRFMIHYALRNLYYPESEKGIKQFQKDIDVEITGELTFGQWMELQRRSTRVNDTEVYVGGFGNSILITELENFLSVEGTWVLEGEKIAYPINKSVITCDKIEKECTVVQANVIIPEIEDTSDNYSLNLDTSTYSVVTWSSGEVIARTSGSCRTSILTINTNSKEVFEVTRNNETERCRDGYLTLPSLDKPRIARLVPGWDRTYGWWKDRKKETSKHMNHRMREAVKKMLKPLSQGTPD